MRKDPRSIRVPENKSKLNTAYKIIWKFSLCVITVLEIKRCKVNIIPLREHQDAPDIVSIGDHE